MPSSCPRGPSDQALEPVIKDYHDTIHFYLNGKKVTLNDVDPEITLLEYLRAAGLTGTKLGCAEGGCGACTVVISQYNHTTKAIYHASVNACLAPVISVDGKHVITVEGIGSAQAPHIVQQRIAESNGSQCGFCTPGIVMSLYALLRNDPEPSEQDIEEAFDGNLCRCTGYRPILEAAQSFGVKPAACRKSGANGGSGPCLEKCKEGQGAASGADQNHSNSKESELIFPPALTHFDFKPLCLGNKRKRWLRPVTLQQLLDIKHAYPAAKIIGGSTETQIEIKFKSMHYGVSIYAGDVAELKGYSMEDDYLDIGGNISLTDLEDVTEKAVHHYGPIHGQVFAAINHQMKYFAGRQIRNVGTPAGSLATASPISDLGPILLAANAIIIAKTSTSTTRIPLEEFFLAYRTTALAPDQIIVSIRIPITRGGEYVRAYKQSKRKDDDISIVTAAFRVALDKAGCVESASLAYGGLAPKTIKASRASALLVGKTFSNKTTLEASLSALSTQDFDLRFGVPGGMATYRKSLALSFFYRFWNDVLSELVDQTSDVELDSIPPITRQISKGIQDHEATAAYQQSILGQPTPHVAALKQTCGQAQYTDDIPVSKTELFGCLVLSSKPHAKLLSVNYDAAMDLPGVVEFISHQDMPSPDVNWWGAPVCDEVFLAVDTVHTAGQPIGMIVAETARQANAGAQAVLVEYEELSAIMTIEEAIVKESFFEHYRSLKKGEPKDAFAEADHIFTGVARMGGQEHFYLETNACVAVPKPEDGEIELFASTQNPSETQMYASKVCDIAANKVVVRVKRLGGGFGGKETRSIQLSTIVALAAKKTGRPVRCMLGRDQDMITSGQRHPFLARWKVGVQKSGKIVALDADVFVNGGWSQDLSGAVLDRGLSHIDGCYMIPNVHVRGRVCKTNTMSNSAFRGFGGPQGIFICENMMEEVADRLDIPVEDLRRMNLYQPGDQTHFNQELKDWHVPIMYQQVFDDADYAARRESIEKFNREHIWKKCGLSLVPTKFGISFTALFLNQAGALVHLYHDGSVLVAHGGTEMGQGLHTKMTMIAAEALGVPLSEVHISETTTNTVANTSSTAASASSDLNGYAIFNACEQLNERLAPYRKKLGKEASMKDLVHAAYFDRVNLSAQGFYKTPDIGFTWGPNTGQMFFYFTQGVAAAEVEIDCLTGDWTCLRADVKMDIGRSINPAIDYGQIEGAFVQGMGLFTMEESLWYRSGPMAGQLATRGPGAYKIPGFRDVPQRFNISMLKDVQWENLRTIQRSRGVGEPPLFLGSSVFFAIRDALKAARAQYGVMATVGVDRKGDGLLNLESPATTERVRTSCVDPILLRSVIEPQEGEKSFFVSI